MRFWTGLNFRTKLALAIVALLLLLGLSFALFVEKQITPRLEEELEKQGVAIARDLAIRSLAPVLTQDLFTLQELIQDTLQFNKEVRYIFLVNSSGKVLAHSFAGGFPTDLGELAHALPSERYQVELLNTEEGLIRHIAVPLYPGKQGQCIWVCLKDILRRPWRRPEPGSLPPPLLSFS